MNLEIFKPTAEQIQNLKVGDKALNPYGVWEDIIEIYGRGQNVEGEWFVCFYTGDNQSSISHSYTENKIVRTLPLTSRFTSAQIDQME
ncbi:MAG: hypothetical protein WC511_02305 [Candidatus Pacearchaeota archaeon]